MKKVVQLLGVAAAAGLAYKVLTQKKANGSTMLEDLTEAGKGWADKLSQYAGELKDKLMPGMRGPNGEDVYMDMYKRNYYMDTAGSRVYMEE
jgi:hypothetical protein